MSKFKAAFHTLGCKTNHYETDAIARQFTTAGFEQVDFAEMADVYLINTCTVTGEADRKSRQMLRRVRKLAPDSVVVAMGCHAELSDASAYADIVIGNRGKNRALALVQQWLNEKGKTGEPPAAAVPVLDDDGFEELGIVDRQSETRAYIKIEDGCNSFCSYCAIPLARGRIRSRDENAILAEARALARVGYQEIVLTGIHVCSYGVDRGLPSHAVMELAAQLATIDGIARIRLGSLEPLSVTPEFIALAAANPKLCPHFHLSLQSGSDAVLARMNRRYRTAEYRAVAAALRQAFPGAGLTTDVIVGFPGETDLEFAESLAFCWEMNFSRMHIFRYSPRQGTRAASLPGQIPAAVSSQRSQAMQDLADLMTLAYHHQQLGHRQTVLVETIREGDWAEGYTPAYVPVRVKDGSHLQPGQIYQVWPTAADNEFLFCVDAN
jgi:threonylcarbamoyladenosine tRNA methylthiotransferase MtaB